jgi:hypothetical protein
VYENKKLWLFFYSDKNINIVSKCRFFYKFLNKKWFFDKVYNVYVGYPLLKVGYNVTFKLIDKGLIELFGPYGLACLNSRS